MSESSKESSAIPLQRNRVFIILIIMGVVLLGIGYGGGYFVLPSLVKSAYQAKNCDNALSRHDLYRSIYPFANEENEMTDLIRECAVYTLATTNEAAEAWRDSYNTFSVYSETYPQGLFTSEVYEHSALVLMGMVNEAVEQKDYSIASNNLNFILENYGDAETVADAEKLKSDLRVELGANLRETGDFVGAEQIFKEINMQAQDNNRTEDVRASQLELAKTYLGWGLELISQENFVEAKAKLDTAMSTDPDPSSSSGPAAQAKASQVDLYTQWGDYLIEQKDFANAMERYKTAATLSGSDDPSAPNDIISDGYIQWATEVGNAEDFLGALILLDFAQERSATDVTKTLVDEARSDLYLAFSKSDGEQAQQAMEDAVRIVCAHNIQPSLPIFGLDVENVRASAYGTDDQLPSESIVATTPASLHYVACVDEETKVAGTLTLPVSTRTFGGGPGTVQVTYANYQYVWNVVLREIDTGKDVETTMIEGAKPATLAIENIDLTTFDYFGSKPDIVDLADWVLTVIE